MEALKNWLLVAAVVAVFFLGLEVRSQARTIGEMKQQTRDAPAAEPTEPSTQAPPASVQTSAPPTPQPAPDAGELLAAEELDRYKSGLERCVAVLNATVEASRRQELRTFILPRVASSAGPSADIVELLEPYVLPSGNSVVVSGKLYNRGSAAGEVQVSVTLFDNGRRTGSERQRVSVGAGQTVSWQQPFPWNGHEAMWTAHVEILK